MISNEKIKELSKLNQKKYRDESGLFLVEGEHLVSEADKHGIVLEKYSIKDLDGFITIPKEKMKKICQTDTVVNQVALCKKIVKAEKTNHILILDRIQDPGNMGTLMRSAVSFGFNTIFLQDGCVDIYNDKVIRSSQGAIFKLNFLFGDALEFIKTLNDYQVFGTNVVSGIDVSKVETQSRFAVVLGNEGSGVSQDIQDYLQQNIYIKMLNTESLNVAIAGSIIMYELTKKLI